MLIAQVDDAEPVAFGVFQHDEVRILRVAVPADPSGAERHEPGRFGLLFAGIGDMQVKVQARVILRRRLAELQRDRRSGPSGGASTFTHPPNPPSTHYLPLSASARQILPPRTLAQRYVEEGLRMDEHPLIRFAEGPAGRRARLLGTGKDVWEVVATVRDNDGDLGQAARYLELPLGLVQAAVS